mmetsp:Transcript_3708/g.9289  ORF Transcript_3708/g.9289 Transcript_3708/m.9289 type:complete len:347 (+) Transcript_3708:233-1273(+)
MADRRGCRLLPLEAGDDAGRLLGNFSGQLHHLRVQLRFRWCAADHRHPRAQIPRILHEAVQPADAVGCEKKFLAHVQGRDAFRTFEFFPQRVRHQFAHDGAVAEVPLRMIRQTAWIVWRCHQALEAAPIPHHHDKCGSRLLVTQGYFVSLRNAPPKLIPSNFSRWDCSIRRPWCDLIFHLEIHWLGHAVRARRVWVVLPTSSTSNPEQRDTTRVPLGPPLAPPCAAHRAGTHNGGVDNTLAVVILPLHRQQRGGRRVFLDGRCQPKTDGAVLHVDDEIEDSFASMTCVTHRSLPNVWRKGRHERVAIVHASGCFERNHGFAHTLESTPNIADCACVIIALQSMSCL